MTINDARTVKQCKDDKTMQGQQNNTRTTKQRKDDKTMPPTSTTTTTQHLHPASQVTTHRVVSFFLLILSFLFHFIYLLLVLCNRYIIVISSRSWPVLVRTEVQSGTNCNHYWTCFTQLWSQLQGEYKNK